MKKKVLFSREEMTRLCVEALKSRGVEVDDIAMIAYKQQARYTDNIKFETCRQSVLKILSLRDIFHHVLLAVEIDKLTEKKFRLDNLKPIIK
jgi:phosphatidylglycerophosphatase A